MGDVCIGVEVSLREEWVRSLVRSAVDVLAVTLIAELNDFVSTMNCTPITSLGKLYLRFGDKPTL